MQKTQTCPVCGKEQIPADRQQCPQCNADLTCFQVLDALPEPEKVKPGLSRKIRWLGAILTVVLLAGLGWWTLHQNFLIMQTVKDNRSSMERLDRSMQTLMRKAEPEKERGAVKPKEARFLWYEATDTDTLWGISERFYQSGRYYPVLLVMNPHLNIYEIKGGQRLKILEDQKDVIAAFNRSITKEGDSVYLWYQVQGGDTLKTLSRKFYKTDDHYSIIHQGNPNLHLEPGQRIRVLLPDLS